MILSLFRKILRWVLLTLSKFGIYAPIVWLCARDITSKKSYGKGQYTLLALNPGRFRGDLECLAQTGKFRIYPMSFEWQGRLYSWFHDPTNGSDEVENQQQYQEFLKHLLPKLIAKLQIDAIIAASFYYRQDTDWQTVAHQLGIPSLAFHREGYMGSKVEYDFIYQLGKRLGNFHTTKLITQTNVHRDILLASGYINDENSLVAGTMRMDALLARAELAKASANCTNPDGHEKQHVVFFSFGPGTGFMEGLPAIWPHNFKTDYLYEYCRLTHVAIAQFAVENPDVEVLIKPKWAATWYTHIDDILATENLFIDKIPNLTMDWQVDAQDAIEQSAVVISYGSTTLLESGIFGKPTIMPFFAEVTEPRMKDYVLFPDIFESFDVAESPEKLKELISYRLGNPEISPEMASMREHAFERYSSPIDGSATGNSANIIIEAIKDSREL